MVVFLKKKQAGKALKHGIMFILNGETFHARDAEQYGLNDQASSWFYTEALVHQIYALLLIFNGTLGKKYDWAIPRFAWQHINEAISEFEFEEGATPGSMTSFIFRRCKETDELTGQERRDGEQFHQSALMVAEYDSSANQEVIANTLRSTSEQYFNNFLRIFG